MPSALTRACPSMGCTHDATTCPTHGRQARAKAYDTRRGSASSRGYGARWARHRAVMMDKLAAPGVYRAGLCGATLATPTTDSQCAAHGYVVPYDTLDHIVPVSGPNDPSFYVPTALQGLCFTCHQRKRQREVRT